MKIKSLLLALFSTMCILPIAAQMEAGKVYRFINKADAQIAMASVSMGEVFGVQKADNNFTQLWQVEKHPNNGDAWSLRNLGNGLYLRPTSTSVVWTFDSKPSAATILYCISTSGGYYTFNTSNNTNGSNCMHYATSQSGAVVGWNTGADATHWKIEEVTVSKEELEANWAELDAFNGLLTDEYINACQTALDNLFEDAACTQLKSNVSNLAALEADKNYKSLPAELQEMARKVASGDWSEPNFDSSKKGWDSEYGKKFRIQSIEPYSIEGEITSWLGFNAHINMDNPTGIFGNNRQHIFVIVESEIKDGAELTLGSMIGHGLLASYDKGIRLHKGLNIIPFLADGNAIYINYVVHTYDASSRTFPHKLSDYPNLKIQIAGGNINGYYNGVGDHIWGEPDDDNDWLYYEERANLNNVTILGKRQILHFCFNDTQGEKGMAYYLPEKVQVPSGTPANQKINKMLEAWDRIHLSELATMGLLSKAEMDSLNALYPRYGKDWKVAGNIYDYNDNMYSLQGGRDYSEYFNHHGVAYGNFSGYMSGGWRNCNYHHNTMGSIIGEIAVNAGSTWGPAHEIGHQHQSPMTVNGLTEVTNNLFSNVAVWYMGMGTSRVNGTEGNLEHVNAVYTSGGDFFDNNIWALTHMYYRLWEYYHQTGHNTQFFPRLYELLRQQPMTKAYTQAGSTTILRFYRHACDAAGEDLTEFFRAHGFFREMSARYVGDYSNSEYTQTQADIDAAIAAVKAKGYRENLAPLFINDCVATASYGHDGKTRRSYWDNETQSGQNAKVGMYTDCIDTSVKAEGYLYNFTNSKVSIVNSNASGAIGFIVYSNGELAAFTNSYSMELPKGVIDIDVYAVQADGEKVKILSTAEGGTEAQQKSALNTSINAATKLLTYVTTTGEEVGYFYEEAVAELRAFLAEAKAAYNNADQSKYTYGKWATMLTAECNKLTQNKYAMVNVKEKNYYNLSNRNGNLAFYNNNLKAASNAQIPSSDNNRKWEFVSTGVDGEFYLKNVGQNKYISEISEGNAARLNSTSIAGAVKFIIIYNGDGTVSVVMSEDNGVGLNVDAQKNIIGYTPSHTNSQWKMTITDNLAHDYEVAVLDELITEAQRALNELGSVDGDKVNINENITIIDNSLSKQILNLSTALAEATENKDTATDLAKYIDALNEAIKALDNKYVASPIASNDKEITWYYIKNIENGTYCGVDTVKTTVTYGKAMSLGELDKDNRYYWWAFEATENEGEYKIYNGKTGNAIYTYEKNPFSIKTDAEKEPGVYTITVDKDNIGLTLSSGTSYWNNITAGYVRVTTSKVSYWKIEKICTEEGNLTGVDEVLGDKEQPEGIYDLRGRRIENITAPGIYIVNGKKVLVK